MLYGIVIFSIMSFALCIPSLFLSFERFNRLHKKYTKKLVFIGLSLTVFSVIIDDKYNAKTWFFVCTAIPVCLMGIRLVIANRPGGEADKYLENKLLKAAREMDRSNYSAECQLNEK